MQRIALLDYARFAACMGVVFYHYFYWAIANGKISSVEPMAFIYSTSQYGYMGIQFFFMISGYVIFFSAKNRSASQFMVARAVRLYPAFWFSALFTSLIIFLFGSDDQEISIPRLIANLTMAAKYFEYEYIDGAYWTLRYEWTFYIVVFLALLFGFSRKIENAFLYWAFLIGLIAAINLGEPKFFGGWYIYFSAGSVLALKKFNNRGLVHGAIWIMYFVCLRHANEYASEYNKDAYVTTVLITIFFAFFLVINTHRWGGLKLPGSSLLGGLTYPIYLMHAEFGYIFLSNLANESNKYFSYICVFLLLIGISLFVHMIVERRMHHIWKNVFEKSIGRCIVLVQSSFSKRSLGT